MANNGGNTVPRITKAEHIGPDDTGDNIQAKRVAQYEFDGDNWYRSGTQFIKKLDDTTTSDTIYIGEAMPGTAEDAATWRIRKIDTSTGLDIAWADSAKFSQVWEDRASLIYS